MTFIWIAIALLVLFSLWLALQPKQGKTAPNSLDKTPDKALDQPLDQSHQLPKPQEPVTESTPQSEARRLPSPFPDPELPRVLDERPATPPPSFGADLDPPSVQFNERIWDLMARNRKIEAIKLVRNVMGWSLKECKDYVETYPNLEPLQITPNSTLSEADQGLIDQMLGKEPFDIDRHDINDRIRIFLAQGKKIEAIQVVKKATNWKLTDVIGYVNAHPAVEPLPVADLSPVSPEIRRLLRARAYMDAIQLVQQRTGMMVEEAKQYLEKNFDANFPF